MNGGKKNNGEKGACLAKTKQVKKVNSAVVAAVSVNALSSEASKLVNQAKIVEELAKKAKPRVNELSNDVVTVGPTNGKSYAGKGQKRKVKTAKSMTDAVMKTVGLYVVTLIITALVIPVSAANCNYEISNGISRSDCFEGVFDNGIFDGNVWCVCNKCTNNWSYMSGSLCVDKPRHMMLDCAFGAPRHGYNCYNSDENFRAYWSKKNDDIKSALKSGNVSVSMDVKFGKVCLNNFCDFYGKPSQSYDRAAEKLHHVVVTTTTEEITTEVPKLETSTLQLNSVTDIIDNEFNEPDEISTTDHKELVSVTSMFGNDSRIKYDEAKYTKFFDWFLGKSLARFFGPFFRDMTKKMVIVKNESYQLLSSPKCDLVKEGDVITTNCYKGVFRDTMFIGHVWCECGGCTNKWAYLETGKCENKPRSHILACRFGGPRHGYNCFNCDREFELWWTSKEEELADTIKNDNVSVWLEPVKGKYCIGGVCDYYSPSMKSSYIVRAASTIDRESVKVDNSSITPLPVKAKPVVSGRLSDQVTTGLLKYGVLYDGQCQDRWIEPYSTECKKYEANSSCIHEAAFHCAMGAIGVHADGKVLALREDSNKICCTLKCFELDQLYDWFTFQPTHEGCFYPFAHIFWTSECLSERGNAPRKLVSLTIFKKNTKFVGDKFEYYCGNAISFNKCCGNSELADDELSTDFVDKFCACKSINVGMLDRFIHKFNAANFYRNYIVKNWFWVIIILVSMFVFKRYFIVLLIILLAMYIPITNAICDVDNIVMINGNVSKLGDNYWVNFYAQMTVGQCIVVNEYTLKLLSIHKTLQYRSLGYVPYKIKLMCSNFNWGCYKPLMPADLKPSTCYSNCTMNYAWYKEAMMQDFAGSGCAIGMAGVHYRVDACFSFGHDYGHGRIFTIGNIHESTKMTFAVQKDKQDSEIVIEGEYDNGDLSIYNVNYPSVTTYEYLIVRSGSTFCSLYHVDVSPYCVMVDPNTLVKHCVEVDLEWVGNHRTYAIKYETKTMEDLIYNAFKKCDVLVDLDLKSELAVVTYKVDTVSLWVKSKGLHSSSTTTLCDVGKLTLSSKKGATGYHDVTLVTVTNKGVKCKFSLYLYNCTNIDPNYAHIDTVRRLSYYCNFWADGKGVLLGNSIKYIKLDDIVNNWKPHKTTLTNFKHLINDYVSSENILTHVGKFFRDINFDYYYKMLLSFVNIDIYQLLISLLCLYIAWINLNRGKMIYVGIYVALFYLFYFSKIVFALEVSDPMKNLSAVVNDITCFFLMLLNWWVDSYFIDNKFKLYNIVNIVCKYLFLYIMTCICGHYFLTFYFFYKLVYYMSTRRQDVDSDEPDEILRVNFIVRWISELIPLGTEDKNPSNRYLLYNTKNLNHLDFDYLLFFRKIFDNISSWYVLFFLTFLNFVRKVNAADDEYNLSDHSAVMGFMLADFFRRLFNMYNSEDKELYEYQLKRRSRLFVLNDQANSTFYFKNKHITLKHVTASDTSVIKPKDDVSGLKKTRVFNIDKLKVKTKTGFITLPIKLMNIEDVDCWCIETDQLLVSGAPAYFKECFMSVICGYYHKTGDNTKYYPLFNLIVDRTPDIIDMNKYEWKYCLTKLPDLCLQGMYIKDHINSMLDALDLGKYLVKYKRRVNVTYKKLLNAKSVNEENLLLTELRTLLYKLDTIRDSVLPTRKALLDDITNRLNNAFLYKYCYKQSIFWKYVKMMKKFRSVVNEIYFSIINSSNERDFNTHVNRLSKRKMKLENIKPLSMWDDNDVEENNVGVDVDYELIYSKQTVKCVKKFKEKFDFSKIDESEVILNNNAGIDYVVFKPKRIRSFKQVEKRVTIRRVVHKKHEDKDPNKRNRKERFILMRKEANGKCLIIRTKSYVKVCRRKFKQIKTSKVFYYEDENTIIKPKHVFGGNDDNYFDITSNRPIKLGEPTRLIQDHHKNRFIRTKNNGDFSYYKSVSGVKLKSGTLLYNSKGELCGMYNATYKRKLILPNVKGVDFKSKCKFHGKKHDKKEDSKKVKTAETPKKVKVGEKSQKAKVIDVSEPGPSRILTRSASKEKEEKVVSDWEEDYDDKLKKSKSIKEDERSDLATSEVTDTSTTTSTESESGNTAPLPLEQLAEQFAKHPDVESFLKSVVAEIWNSATSPHNCDNCYKNNPNNVWLVEDNLHTTITLRLSNIRRYKIYNNIVIINHDPEVVGKFIKHFTEYLSGVSLNTLRIVLEDKTRLLNDYIDEIDLKELVIPRDKPFLILRERWHTSVDAVSNIVITDEFEKVKKMFNKNLLHKKSLDQWLQQYENDIIPATELDVSKGKEVKQLDDYTKQNEREWSKIYNDADSYYFKTVCNLMSVGSAVQVNDSLLSQYHVTKANDVVEFSNVNDVCFKREWLCHTKSTYADFCKYGKEFIFTTMKIGEIVIAYNPLGNWAQAFIVAENNSVRSSKSGIVFYSLLPCRIDRDAKTITVVRNERFDGMSGSPIFNVKGEIVGLYGLSYYENTKAMIDRLDVPSESNLRNYVVINEAMTNNIDLYFKALSDDILTNKLEDPYKCFLVHAPTGVGKSTKFPIQLLKDSTTMKGKSKIIISQPFRAGAINCYNHICDLLFRKPEDQKKYKVQLSIGTATADVNESKGSGQSEIFVMTHGKICYDILHENKLNCDFLLIDEYHNIYDTDLTLLKMLALNDEFKNKEKLKIVLISATVNQENWMHQTQGIDITLTNFEIDDTSYHITETEAKSEKDCIAIPTKLIYGVQLTRDYAKLPIPAGFVGQLGLILVPTQRGCEDIAAYLNKNYKELGEAVPLHSKNLDIKVLLKKNSGIVVATDIAAQSITLKNLYVVWDFMHHYKPSCVYSIDKGILNYEESLDCKVITTFDREQRKGRLGRTQRGYYVQLINVSINEPKTLEESTILPAVFKSIAVTASFIKPKKFEDCWDVDLINIANEFLNIFEVRGNEWKNSDISNSDLKEVFSVIDFEGSPWVYYLNGGIDKETVGALKDFSTWKRFDNRVSQNSWVKKLERLVPIKEQKDFRHNVLSFKESFKDKELYLKELSLTKDELLRQENATLIIGSVAILGAAAGLSASIYENHSTRYVSANARVEKHDIARNAIRTLEMNKRQSACVPFINELFAKIINWIKRSWYWIKEHFSNLFSKTSNVKETESMNAVIVFFETVKIKVLAGVGVVSTTLGFSNLAVMASAMGLGTLWHSINEICGHALGLVTITTINVIFGIFATPMWCGISVMTSFLGFLLERLINRKGSFLGDKNYAKDAWLGLIGSLGGCFVGNQLLKPTMTIGAVEIFKQNRTQTLTISTPNSIFVTFKNIYYIMCKIINGEANEESCLAMLVNAWSALGGMLQHNFMQMALLGFAACAAAFIRCYIHSWTIKLMDKAKFQAGLDLLKKDEEFLKKAFDLLVCGASIVADPTSIISIIIHTFINYQEVNLKTSLERAFFDYSGCNVILGIGAGVLKAIYLMSHNIDVRKGATNSQSTESASTWIIILTSLLGGIYYSVELIKKFVSPAVQEGKCHSAWTLIKGFFLKVGTFIKNIICIITNGIKRGISWVGESVIKGGIDHLREYRFGRFMFGDKRVEENIDFAQLQLDINNMCSTFDETGGLTLIQLLKTKNTVDVFSINCLSDKHNCVKNSVNKFTIKLLNTLNAIDSKATFENEIDYPIEVFQQTSETMKNLFKQWIDDVELSDDNKLTISKYGLHFTIDADMCDDHGMWSFKVIVEKAITVYITFLFSKTVTNKTRVNLVTDIPGSSFGDLYQTIIRGQINLTVLPSQITEKPFAQCYIAKFIQYNPSWMEKITTGVKDVGHRATQIYKYVTANNSHVDSVKCSLKHYDVLLNVVMEGILHNFVFGHEYGYLLMFSKDSVKFENNKICDNSQKLQISEGRFLPVDYKFRNIYADKPDLLSYELVLDKDNEATKLLINPGSNCRVGELFKGKKLGMYKFLRQHSLIMYCFLNGYQFIHELETFCKQVVIPKGCNCTVYMDASRNVYFKSCMDSHKMEFIDTDVDEPLDDLALKVMAVPESLLKFIKKHTDLALLLVCLHVLHASNIEGINIVACEKAIKSVKRYVENPTLISIFSTFYGTSWQRSLVQRYIVRRCIDLISKNNMLLADDAVIAGVALKIHGFSLKYDEGSKALFSSVADIDCNTLHLDKKDIAPIFDLAVKKYNDISGQETKITLTDCNLSCTTNKLITRADADKDLLDCFFTQIELMKKNKGTFKFIHAIDPRLITDDLINKYVPSLLDNNTFDTKIKQLYCKQQYSDIELIKKMVLKNLSKAKGDINEEFLESIYTETQKSEEPVTFKEYLKTYLKPADEVSKRLGERQVESKSFIGWLANVFKFNMGSDREIERIIQKPQIGNTSKPVTNVIEIKSSIKDISDRLTEWSVMRDVQPKSLLEKPDFELETFDEVIQEYKEQTMYSDIELEKDLYMKNEIKFEFELKHFVKGFHKAIVGEPYNWCWFKSTPPRLLDEDTAYVDKTTFVDTNVRTYWRAKDVWKKSDWEQYRYHNRVLLPSKGSINTVVASRAFYKCQQLIEADEKFFSECQSYLDPCCGNGGFVEALGRFYIGRKPANMYVNTLLEAGHAQPDWNRMLVKNSQLKVHKVDDIGNNNIKDDRVINWYIRNFKDNPIDMLIIDVGENSPDTTTNDDFWEKRGSLMCNFKEAVQRLQEIVRPGGKMILKINGPSHHSVRTINELTHKFASIKALKLGTTPDLSNEYYIFCNGYNKNRTEENSFDRSKLLDDITRTYCHQTNIKYLNIFKFSSRANRHIMINLLQEPIKRDDWWSHDMGGNIYSLYKQGELPSGVRLDFVNKNDEKIFVDWSDPQWFDRIKTFKTVANTFDKSIKYDRPNFDKFTNLTPIFSLRRKKQIGHERKLTNSFLSQANAEVFNMDKTAATYCQTQSTPYWREVSFKKKLDLEHKDPTFDVVESLSRCLTLMDTEYAKSFHGKLRFLNKEEVLKMINPKGATSVLEPVANLKALIEKYPNWYEICQSIIDRLDRGKPTGRHYMARAKAEAKEKKNVVNGRLNHEPGVLKEVLEEYNVQGHRYIQFSDGFSRLTDYIIFGDLLNKHNKQKMYKGSFNGLSPFIVGNSLRILWDFHNEPNKRESFIKFSNLNKRQGQVVNYHLENVVTANRNSCLHYLGSNYIDIPGFDEGDNYVNMDNTGPAAIEIDFSSWDGTVTKQERALLAHDYCRFYPPMYHNIIKNTLKEQTFGIVIDDDMDVFTRGGQRGSGEWDTSYGNTKLVAANIYCALSEVLGKPLEFLLDTALTIDQKIGESDGKPIIKRLEVPNVPVVCDGDDTVIFTTRKYADIIVNTIEQPLSRARKVIRSGNKTGASKHYHFNDISFCSHKYCATLIGPKVNDLKLERNEYFPFIIRNLLNEDYSYKMRYLPTRPISSIISKLMFTLKLESEKLDLSLLDDDRFKSLLMNFKDISYYYDDPKYLMSEKLDVKDKHYKSQLIGFEITRAKIHSYLYLYPHDKIIRWYCLGLLSIIGDEATSNYDLIKRYGLLNFPTSTTVAGGLKSIYGIESLDDVSFRNHKETYKDLQTLAYNVSLTKKNPVRNLHDFSDKLFRFMEKSKIRDSKPLSLCTKFAIKFLKYHSIFKENEISFKEDVMILLGSNTILNKVANDYCSYTADLTIPQLVIYSPAGSGKTTFLPKLQSMLHYLKCNHNVQFSKVIDTDEDKIINNSIVITNLPHLCNDLTKCIYIKYDKYVWDSMVKTKCPNWKDNWYRDTLTYSRFSSNVINTNKYLSEISDDIYIEICKILNIGNRKNKYYLKEYKKFIIKN